MSMTCNRVKLLVITAALLLSSTVQSRENTEQEAATINLRNSPIQDFITQVSQMTGKNFVVDSRIKGNVTVISNTRMGPDAVYELFLSVLRVHGFAAVPAGNVTKIVQQVLAKQSSNPMDFSRVDSEEVITAVIPVRNTSAQELVKVLRPLVPQHATINGLESPNVLLISDYANNIQRIEEIVGRIDVSDNLAIEIVDLKEAWVEDIVELLELLAPEEIGKSAKGPNKVTVVASERTNSLVIKGDAESTARVRLLVERLDVPANRSGTVQVVRLAHSDAAEMAEILKNLVSESGGKDGGSGPDVNVSIQPDTALNALVIRADPSTMLELREIISELDVRRLQVLIEAAIVEVTTDFSQQLGSELFIGDASSSNVPLGMTAPTGTLAQILQSIATNTLPANLNLGEAPLIAGGKINEKGTSFAAIVRALSSNGDVNLLSTPSITTMDNQEAKIVVGQNVPFRTGSTLTGSSGTSNPFTTIQREDVGLTLQVTPHIHDGRLVRLEIHQEVSEVDETSLSVIGTEAAADLITNKRTIDTTILVDDQEIIILGGLTRDKESSASSRVPVLGSIPGLGFLFRTEVTSFEKQNLLVFLRPTVLTSRDDIREQSQRRYARIYELEIQGKDPLESLSELFNGNPP